jgi:glyoxylase-like metal-dependent hydrolase (beta-lactamase superfamily II)
MKYSLKEEMPGIWFVDLKVDGEEEYIGSYIVASGKEVALVESGPASTAWNLLDALSEIGFRPQHVKYILLTHVHLDHGGASGVLIEHFPNAYVLAHQRGIPHLVDPELALWKSSKEVLGFVAQIYGKPKPVPKEKVIAVENKMHLALGKLAFEIVPTPGHASHHVCIFLYTEDVIFTGDAAGAYVPSLDVSLPQTPPPFRLNTALESIETLISLKPQLSAYTHFGVSPHATTNLKNHYNQLVNWYEVTNEALSKGIKKEEDILDLISNRDSDLKKFLINSDRLKGLKRGVEVSLKGFVHLIEEEKKRA